MIQLCDENTCTSCGVCASVCPKRCISFVETRTGLKIPQISEDLCVECKACVRTCPQISGTKQLNYPQKAYACWSQYKDVRRSSSSGGVFYELAKHIIGQGGIVVGAAFIQKLELKHVVADKKEQLHAMQGSKYLQSDIKDVFPIIKKALSDKRLVMFVGTPCQVAAIRNSVKSNQDRLICCDLVCHGVPPHVYFDKYLEKIGIVPQECDSFSFRWLEGWGFRLAYNNKPLSLWKQFYITAFRRGYMFNQVCFHCQYAQNKRTGDITLADFWGLGEKYPFKYSKKYGVSCVLVNSDKGMNLLAACSKDVFMEERPLEEAFAGNDNLNAPFERPVEHKTFLEDLITLENKELCKKYKMQPNLRDYLRIIKRILVVCVIMISASM